MSAARLPRLLVPALLLGAIPAQAELVYFDFTTSAPVTTTETYSGIVSISVTGLAALTPWGGDDAFYTIPDVGVPAAKPDTFSINGQFPAAYLLDAYPVYTPTHGYVFRYDAGATPTSLTFSHGDTYTVDNSGGLMIRIDRCSLEVGGDDFAGGTVNIQLANSSPANGFVVVDTSPGPIVIDEALAQVLWPGGTSNLFTIPVDVPPGGVADVDVSLNYSPGLIGVQFELQGLIVDISTPGFLRLTNGWTLGVTAPSQPPPTGLAVTPGATTATLEWAASTADLDGYDVYRALSGGAPSFIGRTIEPRFEDDHLTAGQTYDWEVRAIPAGGGTPGAPSEASATTLSSALGLTRVPRLDVLVAIYAGGGSSYTAADVAAFRNGIDLAQEFYLRHSRGRLHLDLTYLEIDEQAPSTAGPTMTHVEFDLAGRGVLNDQFDAVYVVADNLAGCLGGFVLLGQTAGAFGTACSAKHPLMDPTVSTALMWAFVHEFQHALDGVIAGGSGLPEMVHGHPDSVYSPGYSGQILDGGEHFDWQRVILQDFTKYHLFLPPWDGYVEVADGDFDLFADNDPRLAMDEARFGSLASTPDSDFDGTTDLQEFYAGLHEGSDPMSLDTDGDGVGDTADPHPTLPLARTIGQMSAPTIDGVRDAGYTLLRDGVHSSEAAGFDAETWIGWSSGALHVYAEANAESTLLVYVDGSAANGFWHGDNTYLFTLKPGETDPFHHTMPQSFSGDGAALASGQLFTSLGGGTQVLEATIPVLALGQGFGYTGNLTFGLGTGVGTDWGLRVHYGRIGGTGFPTDVQSGQQAHLGEIYTFYDVELVGP